MGTCKPSVVLLTGDQVRHRYVAAILAEAVDLRGVVFEAKKSPAGALAAKGQDEIVEREHFEARAAAENKYFGAKQFSTKNRIASLSTTNNTINNDDVFAWVLDKNSQYLVLYGCGIVRERLLRQFDMSCINMHLGLSPYYRGSGTNLWALCNGEPECVGVTIHLAVLNVDAGSILRQARPIISHSDSIHDIGCKTIVAGAEILGKTICEYSMNKLQPVVQDLSIGRVYKIKDFSVDALDMIRKNYSSGMIEKYVCDSERRRNIFPIVE